MKCKLIFIFIILLLLIGCSSIQIKREGFFEDEKYIKIVKLYDEWKLEEADKEVEILENIEINNENILRMKFLIAEKRKLKEKLYSLMENIKVSIKNNDIDKIRKYTKKTFLNNKKLNELEKNDFTIFDIYSGNIKFEKEKAEGTAVFNYGDEMLYVNIKFQLEKREWKIVDFFERR
jgi:hypothetical protein